MKQNQRIDAKGNGISIFRHCERSDVSAVARRAKAEAIHRAAKARMDCFVASLLAMTVERQ
jgi:hypothetical protein